MPGPDFDRRRKRPDRQEFSRLRREDFRIDGSGRLEQRDQGVDGGLGLIETEFELVHLPGHLAQRGQVGLALRALLDGRLRLVFRKPVL